jgi:hypothetical protein
VRRKRVRRAPVKIQTDAPSADWLVDKASRDAPEQQKFNTQVMSIKHLIASGNPQGAIAGQ